MGVADQALLIIDMLEDFLRPSGALTVGRNADLVIAGTVEVLARARERQQPVIYVCDRHRPDDEEFKVYPPHCLIGSKGAEIVHELAPLPGEAVVSKRRYSGFFATDLDLLLRERGVRSLTLAGVCTDICILFTAADARMRGYQVSVPTRAVGSFDAHGHQEALRQLETVLGCQLI